MRGIITNLTHLLDERGGIGPSSGPARHLADFLTHVVATFTHDFDAPMALIPCRRRSGRKPCQGILVVNFMLEDDGIIWKCPACHDWGVITHWQNTFWDLTQHIESSG